MKKRQLSGASRRKEQAGVATESRACAAGMAAIWLRGSCPPGTRRGATCPAPEHGPDTAQRSPFPPGWARARPPGRPGELPTLRQPEGAAGTATSGRERELPSALSSKHPSQREGSQATRLQADTIIPQSPSGTATRPALSRQQHPTAPTTLGHPNSPAPTRYRHMGHPRPGDSRQAGVPATPPHQAGTSPTVHTTSPRAQEIHMLGALQLHKGGSLLSVGMCS